MSQNTNASRAAEEATTSTLDRAETEAELGRGARSVVHRIQLDGRAYALKTYRGPEDASAALSQFRREAALQAGLVHDAIPAIYEVGIHRSVPYIISELVEGPTVADLIAKAPFAPGDVLRLGITLSDALDVVHVRGLVHRDIKPRNILRSQEGRYRLIDFGLAGHDEEAVADRAIGTFRYCPPEQLGVLERPIDGRSDLYALGVVLFECAVGQPPFTTDDISTLFHQQLASRPPRVDVLRPGFDAVLASIIEKLLEKDPDDRYQNANALYQDLVNLDEMRRQAATGKAPALGTRGRRVGQERLFVGRDEEMGRLKAHWQQVSRGNGRTVVVAGLPGSGKSRLLEAFLNQEVPATALVLRGRSAKGDPFPLAGLRGAVDGLLHSLRTRPVAEAAELRERIRKAAGQASDLLHQLTPALSEVLGQRGSGALQDVKDLYYNAVVDFFLNLARLHNGAVLWLDDVQWTDDDSRELLLLLSSRLAEAPLLLLLSARNDPDSLPRVESLRELLAGWRPERLDVGPLSAAALGELVTQGLGADITPALVEQLVLRSQGTPLAIWQYFEAMKEEGVLVPAWGRWEIDAEGLNRLTLPSNIYELLTQRLVHLTPASREVLAVAAFLGEPIIPDMLARVIPTGGYRAVQRALGEGREAHLIEPALSGPGYSFVHDRVRETLLQVMETAPAELHARAADYLETLPRPSSRQIFQLAHHTLEGLGRQEPLRAFRACIEAAALANTDHAYTTAWEWATRGAELGIEAELGRDERLRFHQIIGEACYQTDRVAEAMAHFAIGLTCTDHGLTRAALRASIARGTVFTFDTREGTRELERAFQELGRSLPSSELSGADLQARLMVLMKESLTLLASGEGFGEAVGEAREEFRAIIDMCESGFLIGYYDRNPLFSLQCGLLALEPAHRLGETPESCRGLATFSFLMGSMGKAAEAQRFAEMALAQARRVADRQSLAVTQSSAALGLHLGDQPDRGLKLQQEVFQGYGGWMGPIAFQNCCVDLSWNHWIRGEARDNHAVSMAAIRRLETREGSLLGGYVCRANASAMAALAALGRMEEASRHFDEVVRFEAIVPGDRAVPWLSVFGFRVDYYLSQGELGEGFEEAVRRHQTWGIPPERSALHGKQFYVVHAYARVELLSAATDPAERAQRLEAFRAASDELSRATTIRTMRAHERIIRAYLAAADGDDAGANTLLDEAKSLGTEHDNPWALFEEARARARMLTARDKRHWAKLEAQRARCLAVENGWLPRQRAVEREFSLQTDVTRHGTERATVTGMTRISTDGGVGLQRQLEALLSTSFHSASVLDPNSVARVALDESARVLGAERAYLFVSDEETGALRFQCGRSGDRKDLPEPNNYSRTIVERVWENRKAVVLSTSTDAREIGSESVMVYGLRSVLAAPLLAGDKPLGVIYLDNRLVRGVFDQSHIGILMALGHHITTALQTARTAHLEVQLRAETEKRRLAEMLRELNCRLTSTLDQTETLEQLTSALSTELPCVGMVVAIFEEDGPRAAVVRGYAPESLPPGLAQILRQVFMEGSRGPHITQLREEDEGPMECLTVPLSSREALIGCLAVVRRAGEGFSRSDLDMAETLVGQANIAIDNARLFKRIRTLAERDELTSLFNRREFFRRAEGMVELARTRGGALSAVMFDVDHFKRFNDTYGHAVGDQVLKLVSQLSERSIRDTDVLGRYGGEEFAVLLPGATSRVAATVAERLRASIEGTALKSDEHGDLRVTVSIGISAYTLGDDLKSLLARADKALYTSKEKGRNTLTVL